MRLTATARCVLSHVVRQKPILKTLPLPLLLAAHGPGREGGEGGRAGGYKVYGSPCHCQCYTAQRNTQRTHTHTDTPRGPLAGPRTSHDAGAEAVEREVPEQEHPHRDPGEGREEGRGPREAVAGEGGHDGKGGDGGGADPEVTHGGGVGVVAPGAAEVAVADERGGEEEKHEVEEEEEDDPRPGRDGREVGSEVGGAGGGVRGGRLGRRGSGGGGGGGGSGVGVGVGGAIPEEVAGDDVGEPAGGSVHNGVCVSVGKCVTVFLSLHCGSLS